MAGKGSIGTDGNKTAFEDLLSEVSPWLFETDEPHKALPSRPFMALGTALDKDDLKRAQLIASKHPETFEERDCFGGSLLVYARSAAAVRWLLASLDPSSADADGASALSYMAGSGSIEALAELAKRADLESKDRHGSTALIYAVREEQEECCILLLDAGANPDAANAEGESALCIAARCGYSNIAKALLSAGADPRKTDAAGMDPFMHAMAGVRHHPYIDTIKTAAILAPLRDPNAVDGSGRGAMEILIEKAEPPFKNHLQIAKAIPLAMQGMDPQEPSFSTVVEAALSRKIEKEAASPWGSQLEMARQNAAAIVSAIEAIEISWASRGHELQASNRRLSI